MNTYQERMEQLQKDHWSYDLFVEYKHLFSFQSRYIECDSGWKKPISKMLEAFEWYRKSDTHEDNPNYDPNQEMLPANMPCRAKAWETKIQIVQIKEKFGSLRVYFDVNHEKLRSRLDCVVAATERECLLRCEHCGELHENGVSNINGWFTCTCDKCKFPIDSTPDESLKENV